MFFVLSNLVPHWRCHDGHAAAECRSFCPVLQKYNTFHRKYNCLCVEYWNIVCNRKLLGVMMWKVVGEWGEIMWMQNWINTQQNYSIQTTLLCIWWICVWLARSTMLGCTHCFLGILILGTAAATVEDPGLVQKNTPCVIVLLWIHCVVLIFIQLPHFQSCMISLITSHLMGTFRLWTTIAEELWRRLWLWVPWGAGYTRPEWIVPRRICQKFNWFL